MTQKTPIDLMLDAVEWEVLEVPVNASDDDGIPYATHRGILMIAGGELECYVLSDGTRVLAQDSLRRFFGMDEPEATA